VRTAPAQCENDRQSMMAPRRSASAQRARTTVLRPDNWHGICGPWHRPPWLYSGRCQSAQFCAMLPTILKCTMHVCVVPVSIYVGAVTPRGATIRLPVPRCAQLPLGAQCMAGVNITPLPSGPPPPPAALPQPRLLFLDSAAESKARLLQKLQKVCEATT
jgi:hypothetical protein